MDRPIAALEITSKAAKLIVGYVIDDEVCVVYSSMLPLEGAIVDGEIRDFEKVSDVLKTLANIKDESKKLKINISEVVLGLPPIGLEVYQNDKVTNVVSDDGRISRVDISNVISLVKKEQVKTVDKIVDIIPDVFILDRDQVFYTPPIGKVSNSLALNAKVHTLPKNIIDGYLRVCENASLRVKRIMVTPYALGELFKTYKDIPDHYLLIDMGANLTTISLMGNKSRLFASTYIAKGGDDLTNFLQDKFHLDFKVANDLKELYGDEIKERYQYLPEEIANALPKFLTEWCFGDCYSRKAMDIKTRELLIFCVLTALNATGQLYSHALGNLKVGNSLDILYAALIQCLPYLGFPCIFNAFNAIKELAE